MARQRTRVDRLLSYNGKKFRFRDVLVGGPQRATRRYRKPMFTSKLIAAIRRRLY
jgi:hypothetical protein